MNEPSDPRLSYPSVNQGQASETGYIAHNYRAGTPFPPGPQWGGKDLKPPLPSGVEESGSWELWRAGTPEDEGFHLKQNASKWFEHTLECVDGMKSFLLMCICLKYLLL